MSILAAEISPVKIGLMTIDGLLIEGQGFGIGFPQVCVLFDVPQKNASRDFKSLLGKDSTFLKVKIVDTRVTMQSLALTQFEVLAAKLDRKGNKLAQDFRDSLVGLSLQQLFSDAFKIKFEEEDRWRYLVQRQIHQKQFHPIYTAWLKADGVTTTYGTEVNRLKCACGLPLICIDEYDSYQVSRLNQAEASYNSLRLAGLNHDKALEIVSVAQQVA